MLPSWMWFNMHFYTFSKYTVVVIQNTYSGVNGAILATVSVLTLVNEVFLKIGQTFWCLGCLVIEISAETCNSVPKAIKLFLV